MINLWTLLDIQIRCSLGEAGTELKIFKVQKCTSTTYPFASPICRK